MSQETTSLCADCSHRYSIGTSYGCSMGKTVPHQHGIIVVCDKHKPNEKGTSIVPITSVGKKHRKEKVPSYKLMEYTQESVYGKGVICAISRLPK
jgi:hypothetical protein